MPTVTITNKQILNRKISLVLGLLYPNSEKNVQLKVEESEKLSGFVSICNPTNPIGIIENMGLVQLRLKVTYVIILNLRLQCRHPSINCWVLVIEWSFANVKLTVFKCFQFDFSRIEDEYQIQ